MENDVMVSNESMVNEAVAVPAVPVAEVRMTKGQKAVGVACIAGDVLGIGAAALSIWLLIKNHKLKKELAAVSSNDLVDEGIIMEDEKK